MWRRHTKPGAGTRYLRPASFRNTRWQGPARLAWHYPISHRSCTTGPNCRGTAITPTSPCRTRRHFFNARSAAPAAIATERKRRSLGGLPVARRRASDYNQARLDAIYSGPTGQGSGRERGDSEMTERRCAWCGGGMAGAYHNAKFCGSQCREREKTYRKSLRDGYWPKDRFGPRPPAKCAECGETFEQKDPRQIYCVRNGRCSQSAFLKSDNWKKYKSRPEIKERMRRGSQKHGKTEKCRQQSRIRARKLRAERALALLLLPVTKPPEE